MRLFFGEIEKARISQETVFITSPVKYLPLRKTPNKSDIKHGKTHLEKQLAIIQPEIIVCLGRVAQLAVLQKPIPLVDFHRRIVEEQGRKIFITYHPAAAFRFPKIKKLMQRDFSKLKSLKKMNSSI